MPQAINDICISTCTLDDLSMVLDLYEQARKHQQERFPENTWPVFDVALIKKDIKMQRLYKLSRAGTVVGVWTISFTDPFIWLGSEQDKAIYLHRIARNRKVDGYALMDSIVSWCKSYAIAHDLHWVRMDTCGHNQALIEYYKSVGFKFLGVRSLQDFEKLPSHYHHVPVCYFELRVV